jgi:hypothetical protein
MNDVVIYPNKRFLIAMAVGCLAMVSACILPLVYELDIGGNDALGRFFQAITPGIFYVGAPLFGLLLVYACYRLLKPAPSVIINQEGIFDNASIFGAGLIRWEEIKSMFVYAIGNNPFLGIVPVDIETVLARQSGIKRFIFRMNKGMTEAPFAIPGGGLPITADELLAKIESYRKQISPDRA